MMVDCRCQREKRLPSGEGAVELGVSREGLMVWGREVLESQHGKAGRMRVTQNPGVAEKDVRN